MNELKVEDLLNPKGLRVHTLPILGKTVCFRGLSYGESILLTRMTEEPEKYPRENIPAEVVSMATYNKAGERLFKDKEIASLLPTDDLTSLFMAIQEATSVDDGKSSKKKRPLTK